MVAAVQIGIALGTVLGLRLARGGLTAPPAVPALAYGACVVALTWPADGIWVPALVLATQVLGFGLLGLHLGRVRSGGEVRAAGRRLGLFQLALVALLVLHALARTWSFFPEILWPLVRGRESLFLALLGLALPLAALGGRRREPAPARRPIRRSEIAAPAGLVALSLALVFTGWGRPSEARPEGSRLRVMSLNVQFFRIGEPPISSSLGAVAALLRRERPDVVGLQETDTGTALTGGQNALYWLGERLGYRYVSGPPSTTNTPGVAILTRCRVLDSSWVRLPFSRTIPRGAVRARLDCAGTELDVINTHIHWAEPSFPDQPRADYERDQRDQIAAVLESTTGSDRFVLLGDFNAGPAYPGPAYDILSSRLTDAWVAAGHPPESPAGHTWPARAPEMRIDFAWLSPGDWRTVPGSARALGGEAIVSDHRAVVVDLRPAPER